MVVISIKKNLSHKLTFQYLWPLLLISYTWTDI